MTNHQFTNELIHETSPYLLQHAHNPVNWHAWNEKSLQKARDENKLLIISIGYSSCHWCHVMEHESFEDSTVAAIMNEYFVPIKVDREERPDVDDVYMTACQISTGRGGWPLNAFALPDGRPVWAGTYFPKEQWINILNQFVKIKTEKPERLEGYAKQIENGLATVNQIDTGEEPPVIDDLWLKEITATFKSQIDPIYGGRKGAPKFPMPNNYEFLLSQAHISNDTEAARLVYTTLEHMGEGGIFDHIAGGFARYSVDDIWKVPHFEKMLYDNGQLMDIYAHAFQKTNDPFYKEIIEKCFDWLQNEMLDKSGGFYAALDADSEGEEGKYYVWTARELEEVLGTNQSFDIITERYEITARGNWEHGNNILHAVKSIDELTVDLDMTENEIKSSLDEAFDKLAKVRSTRIRPGLDDKILTSWNALMAHGLMEAYKATSEDKYLDLAKDNISFLIDNQLQSDNRLNRNFKNGNSNINAFLDDYALLIRALINLYSCTFDETFLFKADDLTQYVLEHFTDESNAMFFYTSDIDPPLVTRKKELNDNVIPASNSIMARNLIRLGQYLYKEDYIKRARIMTDLMLPQITKSKQPSFYSNWINATAELKDLPYEVAIVGKKALELNKALSSHYLPNAILLGGPTEGKLKLLKEKLQEGETYIYVCQNKVCKFPVTSVDEALELIN